jgi:LEA14-like dessication related protein
MKAIRCLVLLLAMGVCACRQPKELVYQDIQNFSLKQAGLKQTTVSMDIRLYNPNSYALKLKKADVDVFLNNGRVGHVKMKERAFLPGRDTCSLPILLDVDLQNVLPNALQLLFNNDVEIKLTGTLKAGRHGVYINIPIDYSTKQNIFGN